jgi:hypothetical protein
MVRDPNRDALIHIAGELGTLRDEFVFVGGSIIGLYITDPAAPSVRPTDDVDVIVSVATRREYDHRIRDALMSRGFSELIGADVPICAWQKDGIRLDVMPTDEELLGFSNRWYEPALAHTLGVDLEGVGIRIADPPFFLAMKIEAFQSRGGGDYLKSHDLEDILAVLDGRPSIVEEVRQADEYVRLFLAAFFSALLREDQFHQSVPGHLIDPGRDRVVLSRIEALASLK